MPVTHENLQLTLLKLRYKTDEEGVSTKDGYQHFPLTPTLLDRLNIQANNVFKVRENKVIHLDSVDRKRLERLRDYQLGDVSFLAGKKSAGCFNEQRTGKTPTILSTLDIKGHKKILIVCPTSTCYQWKEEVEKWTDYSAVVFKGTATQREKLINSWEHGVGIIGYDALRTRTVNGVERGDVNILVKIKDIDCIVLDEAHRIKDPKSNQAKAAFKLSLKIPSKYALTGTPAPNKQEEIFSILKFLYPKLFTSYWKFMNYYFDVGKKTLYINGQRREVTDKNNITLKKPIELTEFLSAVSTQRKRKEVMQWLPDKDQRLIKLPMTDKQDKYIKELHEYFETEDLIVQGHLDSLIRERQILLSPSLVGLTGSSPKTNWIKQYMKDYPDESIIIFSKFTKYLEELATALKTTNLLTGKQTKEFRNGLKKDFQSGKIKLLLIQIDAGKEGLTLDKGDTIIFADKFPPVGDIQQAEDRFVATTEDKADKQHKIITLVMKGSYEERIIQNLENNASETAVLNDYKEYLKGGELNE